MELGDMSQLSNNLPGIPITRTLTKPMYEIDAKDVSNSNINSDRDSYGADNEKGETKHPVYVASPEELLTPNTALHRPRLGKDMQNEWAADEPGAMNSEADLNSGDRAVKQFTLSQSKSAEPAC